MNTNKNCRHIIRAICNGCIIISALMILCFGIFYGMLSSLTQIQHECKLDGYSTKNHTCHHNNFNFTCYNMFLTLQYVENDRTISSFCFLENIDHSNLIKKETLYDSWIENNKSFSCCYRYFDYGPGFSIGICKRTIVLISVLVPFACLFCLSIIILIVTSLVCPEPYGY